MSLTQVLAELPALTLSERQLLVRRAIELDVRWRYPARFPYRVIYRVKEGERSLLVIALLHATRQGKHWQRRVRGVFTGAEGFGPLGFFPALTGWRDHPNAS